jgi:hypothetical protein
MPSTAANHLPRSDSSLEERVDLELERALRRRGLRRLGVRRSGGGAGPAKWRTSRSVPRLEEAPPPSMPPTAAALLSAPMADEEGDLQGHLPFEFTTAFELLMARLGDPRDDQEL